MFCDVQNASLDFVINNENVEDKLTETFNVIDIFLLDFRWSIVKM